MRHNCLMSPAVKSQQAILEAAAAVLTANPGASLARIAEEAGVGRATLYRHFSSREDLVRALAMESIREIDESTADLESRARSARHALELIFAAVAPLGERYHFLTRETGLLDDPELACETKRQAAAINKLIEAAKAEGSIAREVPTAWVAAAFDALIYAAWSAVEEGSIARNDAGGLAFRTLLDGLSSTRRTENDD